MKIAKRILLFPVLILSSVALATAGDSGYDYHHTSETVRVHSRWDDRPRAIRILGFPFVLLGRAGETVLHAPQILSEAIEGDRAFVNRRGVLAPREVPVEDAILSPGE